MVELQECCFWSFDSKCRAFTLFVRINAPESAPEPANIVTPEKTISFIRSKPDEMVPCIGRPVSEAIAATAKYVPSMAPRSCVWPPATSTRHGVMSETKAPEKKPKNRAKKMRPPTERW